ncbi:alanyl-tRNA synthetase [Thioalkalivibrio sulfidiphilus HL-EbGr7]|uniref:Alanine--tRNA ligase n=1 Tax=Thioalkalivibrio sulfidiphilus (strain HL-EbGR7) TaxID=396588 RepID=B8GQV5_THISH|nr:alanine--tRNA ligase [Thioalkalivibrio sulfidiphilus]ACL72375.1 alanyl-tRNA synthetase [Thioalkalivibrio sulfidiphilus HL-EbGr7]
MKSADLRTSFLEYFRSKGHEVVPSSPLIPGNDPTLLFTNAGMVQFKDVFLGREQRPYVRATSSQRCVRAGGKHNDLENVGYTARHHTFFEMLGNFSFGDYFKREAIQYAWEYLTQVLKLPEEKLWVTVFEEDDEAADIWLKDVGVNPERFSRIGASDNFWSMGDTGPCGPCTEIFYDHGPEVPGGPPGTPEADGDRYIEIWNLVFMQYDRAKDGTLTPLPRPSVDTGMGLERLAAVMQGVHSNYEIDLFQNLIRAIRDMAKGADPTSPSLRVIADHIRSCSFLVADGVMPANEGRGYVLRRIIRRAARHGHKLGLDEPFFHRLVGPLVAEMGEAYPELVKAQPMVERVLRQEEERFAETLEKGLRILEEDIDGLKGTEIPGKTIFVLYDTYGFPVDLTGDIARERGLTLDMAGFEAEMEIQRERARAASHFDADYHRKLKIEGESAFTGYEHLDGQGRVTALFKDGEPVDALASGEHGLVVLDETPFYAESGGQVGDTGELLAEGVIFEVTDTRKHGAAHAHMGRVVEGRIAQGDVLGAKVNQARRQAVVLNHSATHLMHAALREILGDHVQQKGSLVAPDRLRFDFSHFQPVSAEELERIERRVNEAIRANAEAEARIMPIDQALESGAMALFGEKYGDEVRVLSMGGFSTELCGGTHVRRTGDIGVFKILSESGVASGIRRIEAVTGENALNYIGETEKNLSRIAEMVKAGRGDLDEKVALLVERSRQLEKELEALKGKLASAAGSSLADQAVEVNGIKVLAANLEGADPKSLRDTVDQLKNKLGEAAVVLATVKDGKVSLVAGVTQGQTARLKAGELVNAVAQQVGGKGGGRPDMAMAGGTDPSGLPGALASVPDWVRERLG